ncbi:hypothetical protein D1BOALGB6SA_8950 [Olavius sp. associated proteobacterium Delta 1]|nr:hypothetical protein D1BOALGB6SA_8950 [Olavius sp. associated proteobacterium Delta 1]
MDYCFAADRTLGKLAKWLRILGFDTIFESDISNKRFYDHLAQERVLLTRTAKIRDRFATKRLVFIEADDVYEQLRQVIDEMAIARKDIRVFSMCLQCNSPIIGINKIAIYGLVPDYIWQTHDEFSKCLQCERIYWSGSHVERSTAFIEKLFD